MCDNFWSRGLFSRPSQNGIPSGGVANSRPEEGSEFHAGWGPLGELKSVDNRKQIYNQMAGGGGRGKLILSSHLFGASFTIALAGSRAIFERLLNGNAFSPEQHLCGILALP